MTEPPDCPSCTDAGSVLPEGYADVAIELSTRGFAALWDGLAHRPEALVAPADRAVAAEAARLLAVRGRCQLDGNGRLVGMHGLTLRNTRHRFVHRGRSRNTWCAFDAVGIPVAFGISAMARTDCAHCHRPLTVTIRNGTPLDVAGVVLWLPPPTDGNLIADFCAHADLFCSADHLSRHVTETAPAGRSADLAEVAVAARATWADVAALLPDGTIRHANLDP